jgi:DNA-binding CsgD family transcriptional regulator
LHNLRVLTCSDMAILTLRDPSGLRVYGDQVSQELLSSYTNHFADLDRGRRAACDFGLEVWNLRQLWQPGELERSQYYQLFALPNRLHDSVGLTLQLPDPRAEIYMVFHRARPGPAADIERRRDLLALMLEPLRAAFQRDLGANDPTHYLSSLMNACGQALTLYASDGSEVMLNAVMRRVLAQDPERDLIRSQTREVALSALTTIAPKQQNNDGSPKDGTRREVITSHATYSLRGSTVSLTSRSEKSAILVSVDRIASPITAPDSLRTRYGLTVREIQVASLLIQRLTNLEIARMLGISPHTARHHTQNVLAKLGLRSRHSLRVWDGLRTSVPRPAGVGLPPRVARGNAPSS